VNKLKKKKTEIEKSNFRYNLITTIIYLLGIILLVQLFNLQIVNGADYRETSNTRLSREGKIEAARGNITDRTGAILATTETSFSVEMYKTNVENSVLNDSILLMTTILEENGDSYINTFPISTNPFAYNFSSDEELAKWKTTYKIPETASAEEAFYLFRDKYGINSDDITEISKILAIRYAITTQGYSSTKSIEISSKISRNSAVKLQERGLDLTGVSIVQQAERVYTKGTLASHILGYVSRITDNNKKEFEANNDDHKYETDDKVGQTGVEKVFEEYLRGEDGTKQIDMNVDGSITGEYTSQEAVGGATVVLTIDANLQQVAEEALANNIEKIKSGGFSKTYDANGGCVVVTNVKTGEILAMASYPDYNPSYFSNGISQAQWNIYNDSKLTPLRNRAIQNAYAPGSIFKMITAIAGLNEGKISVSDKVYDSGEYYVEGTTKPYRCWIFTDYGYGHRWVNVSDAIQKSCNYYFYELGSRTGIDLIAKYAKYFGLGSKTGIELPNEVTGTVPSQALVKEKENRNWSTADTIIAAIGQSYNNYTPVQMAKYISILANGGKKIDLSIVKNVVLSNGTQVAKSEIDEFVKNKLNLNEDDSEDIEINQEYLNAVLQGMKSVAEEEGGTAYTVFKDFEISVGGKTGSAEAGSNVNAWFVGFAPFEDPEIAVVVMVENGGHGYYTAEVVKEIISEYFGMNTADVKENMSARNETESFR
jgi:penicillin-binding protein 2